MLDQLASEAAVALLNRLLARESWAREKLAAYAGRVAQIEAPPLTVRLAVNSDGTFAVGSGEPQVRIEVDTAQLPRAALDPQALKRNLRLAGDADFAQALAAVLENLRPEPEEELARFVGDAAAVRLVGLLRALLQGLRDGGARLVASGADYFVAEEPLLTPRTEMEAFARQVTALRDDVERLLKRVERLEHL
ncbi:MAG: SCP2 sterol-binding domain-containing protein [Burkholderiaceae bacterium]|nr:SCP2 sterol-binding domain-containing protein [Burkholderiaceae bacterium]